MKITQQQYYNKSQQCCKNRGLVVDIDRKFYVHCTTIPQPFQHVHDKLTIDSKQKNYTTHNKARIPTAASQQQVHSLLDWSKITVSQQLYNGFTTR